MAPIPTDDDGTSGTPVGSADPWTVYPKVGFGFLRFGMRAEEVAAHDETYGVPDQRAGLIEPFDPAGIDRDIAGMEQWFTPEQIKQLEADLLQAANAGETETRLRSGVTLDYRGGRLVAIHLAPDAQAARLAGVPLFRTDASTLVFDLASNDDEVLFLRGDIVLPRLGAVLSGFFSKTAPPLRPLGEPRERVVSLLPNLDDLDLGAAKPLSLSRAPTR